MQNSIPTLLFAFLAFLSLLVLFQEFSIPEVAFSSISRNATVRHFTKGAPNNHVIVPRTNRPTNAPTAKPTRRPTLYPTSRPTSPDTLDWFTHESSSSSLWSFNLKPNTTRTPFQRAHPQIAFIKTVKVGGTSVAMALDHVSRKYSISHPAIKKEFALSLTPTPFNCSVPSSLWIHHAYKRKWLEQCIPNVRYITLLREPLSQALSWPVFSLNLAYYNHYPDEECKTQSTQVLNMDVLQPKSVLYDMLQTIEHCRHTAFRRNITMQLTEHHFQSPGYNLDLPVYRGFEWITGGDLATVKNAPAMMNYLKENYFLVGVTEHINTFLVLLGLHMGWDLSSLYYIRCKPNDLNIDLKDFESVYPDTVSKMRRDMAPAQQVYRQAKHVFEVNLARLLLKSPGIRRVLANFERGLKAYQEENARSTMRWVSYQTVDGQPLGC